MPKIRMRRSIVGEDQKDWTTGSIQDASPHYAEYCVRRGVADLIEDGPPAKPAALEDRAVRPSHRDPETKPTDSGGRRRRR